MRRDQIHLLLTHVEAWVVFNRVIIQMTEVFRCQFVMVGALLATSDHQCSGKNRSEGARFRKLGPELLWVVPDRQHVDELPGDGDRGEQAADADYGPVHLESFRLLIVQEHSVVPLEVVGGEFVPLLAGERGLTGLGEQALVVRRANGDRG